ncbi:MAG: hypothetical protein PHC61_04655 [Chitinivibrionales bacterium]|nr:hypothetical protein [Chitinivibrionales bacterium]
MKRYSKQGAFICGLVAMIVLSGFISPSAARALLQKQITYVADGKTGDCKYWTLFLGNFPISMTRNFPGDSAVSLKVDMNYMLVSSGFVEGNGYSSKGRIDSKGHLYIVPADNNKRELAFDEIASIRDDGQTVETKKGEKGALLLVADDNELKINQLLLRKFNVLVDQGDTTLLLDDKIKDYPVSTVSFSDKKSGSEKKARKSGK